jgi:hypothetical protein
MEIQPTHLFLFCPKRERRAFFGHHFGRLAMAGKSVDQSIFA